jgi:hypothetical protein
MRRLCAGFGNAVLMWAELLGMAESGWKGAAAVLTLSPLAVILTPVAFAAGVVRGR